MSKAIRRNGSAVTAELPVAGAAAAAGGAAGIARRDAAGGPAAGDECAPDGRAPASGIMADGGDREKNTEGAPMARLIALPTLIATTVVSGQKASPDEPAGDGFPVDD